MGKRIKAGPGAGLDSDLGDIWGSIWAELEAKRATINSRWIPSRTDEQQRMFPPLLAVRHGPAPPDDAYVAVPYRKQW